MDPLDTIGPGEPRAATAFNSPCSRSPQTVTALTGDVHISRDQASRIDQQPVAKGCPFPLPAGSPPDPEIWLGTLLEEFPTLESIIEAARRGGYEVCGLDRHTGASRPETRAVHRRAARLHPLGASPLPSSDDEPGNRRRACILLSGAIRRGKDCSVRPMMPGSRSGLKDARFPQISAPAPTGRARNPAPPRAAAGGRVPRSLTPARLHDRARRLSQTSRRRQ